MKELVGTTRKIYLAKLLYLFNASILIAHEIDSAYWHEWDLFGLPGGIELFLLLNLILVMVVLYGFSRVVRWSDGSFGFSVFLAIAGIFAFTIHMFFIAIGHPEFRSPTSVTLLSSALLISVAQLVVIFSCRGISVSSLPN